jgi:photosystem II stability/assembly factor-like uncharacterized protein
MRTNLLLVCALAFFPASAQQEPAPPGELDGEADAILERARLYALRHGEAGRIDAEERRARLAAEVARRERSPLAITGPSWISLGPTTGAGRAKSIAPHPTLAGTVYVGTADGGIWKTADGGATWTPLTEGLPDLSYGAVAVAPSSPSTIYAGTGEPDAGDSVPGIGLLKSTDGGAHWQIPATVVASGFYRLSVHPTNALEVLAATSVGALRTTDGGSTWTTSLAGTPVTDLVRHPTNPAILYGTTFVGGNQANVYKSTDSGVTWTAKMTGLPDFPPPYQRIAIAIAPSSPSILYAATGGDYSDGIGDVSHAWKSTDGGDKWVEMAAVETGVYNVRHYLSNQAWYDNAVVVSPTNPNVVLLGGLGYIQSTDGGATFAQVSGPPHVDVHDMRYQGSTLWIANDGGVYTSTNDGNTTTSRNAGLVTRQYYQLALDPGHPARTLGGSQDNGTDQRQDSAAWRNVFGSDGISCAVNTWAGEVAYATIQHGGIFRTESAGSASAPAFMRVAPRLEYAYETVPFYTLLTAAYSDPRTLYTGSDTKIYRSTDGGDSWTKLGLSGPEDGFSAIAVARSDESVLWVSGGGYLTGHGYLVGYVYRSTDGGATWTDVTVGLPSGLYVNHVEVDPKDAATAYVSLATTGGAGVYQTTDGGATWTPASTGLPLFAPQVVRVDPTSSNVLYCGTEVGVFASGDRGGSWSRYGSGLPATSVDDIRILEDRSVIRAGTHGRGAWELSIPASANHAPVAAISGPAFQTVARGTRVLFHGTVSDADGDATSGRWTFGDDWRTVPAGTGAVSASNRFDKPGRFSVSLGAKDPHGAFGTTSVTVDVPEPADDCATPAVIPGIGPFPYTLLLENQNASAQVSDPLPSCYATLNTSLWVSFTPSVAGTYVFSTCGAQLDTVMAIYQGSSACSLTASAEKACGHFPGVTPCTGTGAVDSTLTLAAGQKVLMRVSSDWLGDTGSIPVHVWQSTTAANAPRVSVVSPRSSPRTGGTVVTLEGDDLYGSPTLSFGGAAVSCQTVGFVLQCVAPPHAAGVVELVLTTTQGSTKVGNAFTYYTDLGDADADGAVNVRDVFYLINYLFAGGAAPIGPADANGDGAVTISDVFWLINYLFAAGPAPL